MLIREKNFYSIKNIEVAQILAQKVENERLQAASIGQSPEHDFFTKKIITKVKSPNRDGRQIFDVNLSSFADFYDWDAKVVT